MSKCYIFGSSKIDNYDFYKITENSYVIAADGGYEHIKNLNLTPDLIIGDFDSLSLEIEDRCKIFTAPCEKDETDMFLAVKNALENGCTEIYICGGLGGRLDHSIANIQLLEYIYENGAVGVLLSEENIVTIQTKNEQKYPRKSNKNEWYFSIFSLTETAKVTISGTKYNCENVELKRNFALGVSNEIVDEYAKITLFDGILLVIYSKK